MVVGSSVSFYFAVATGCYSFFWIGSGFYNQFFLKAILALVSFEKGFTFFRKVQPIAQLWRLLIALRRL